MKARTPIGVFVVAAGLAGSLTAAFTWPIAPEPEPRPEACARADDLADRIERGRATLAAEHERLRALRAEDERMTGAPLARPQGLPESFVGPAARARAAAILAPLGVEIVGIDCAEHPCVLTAEWSGPLERPAPDVLDALLAADLGHPAGEKSIRVWPPRRLVLYAVALLGDGETLSGGEELRVKRRTRAALAEIEAARSLGPSTP